MNLNVGFIPYLNMVPFHQGFGPEPIQAGDHFIQFQKLSPRQLGLVAEAGRIDAGAMSLVDYFRLSDQFEPLGDYGIGVKQAAGSVLLFSKVPLADLHGICAVTDETSTSVRLLQVLVEKWYHREDVSYGRIASSELFDGEADALLLIGDEALRARRQGIKGLPIVTDLATEWFSWQKTPFVFARWVIRKDLAKTVKNLLETYLDNSLKSTILNRSLLLNKEGEIRGFSPSEIGDYWDGFCFKLAPEYDSSVKKFREYVEQVCLTA